MGTIPLPKSCGLYLPGHEVHWIQGIHSNDEGEVPPAPCTVVEVLDDGSTVVEISGRRLELWTHDPERLRAIVAENKPRGSYPVPLADPSGAERRRAANARAEWCVDVTPAPNPERGPCPASQQRTRHSQLGGSMQAVHVSALRPVRWLKDTHDAHEGPAKA